jgi:hypothetical protein
MPTRPTSYRPLLAVAALVALTAGAVRAEEKPQATAAPAADPAADALASELRAPSTGAASLRLYGFADFSYSKWLVDSKNSWWPLVAQYGAFQVGNINLYLDGQLGPRARSLIEVRFTYLPNGEVVSVDPSTGTLITNGTTGVRDYTRSGFDLTAWGGIVIERAYVEWTFSQALTLRGGQFLTPYGIWNVDHGSPVIIGVQRPYVINAQVMPERQVGLEAYGTRYFGSARFGYHLTLSNGRNASDPLGTPAAFMGQDTTTLPQYAKYNGTYGVGGRAFVEGDWAGDLQVGVSGYTGRFTKRIQGWDLTTGAPVNVVSNEYDEWVAGLDVRWQHGPFLLQAEGLYQEFVPTAAVGPARANQRMGAYLVLGWMLPWEVMPYLTLQVYDQDHQSAPLYTMYGAEVGVNVHVLPNLVLKACYANYEIPSAPAGSVYVSPLRQLAAQAAWAF